MLAKLKYAQDGVERIIRLDSFIVAKIYDPIFAPEDENWKGHRAKRCVQLKDHEIRAYSKLVQLQGRDIPELYGEYLVESEYVAVLLFQFVV